jgi:4-diphosphocytidyl-2-C-methyl-D-erythritol kinase
LKSFAKVNIFLKIVGKRGNYHELISRFMIVKSLYDDVYFEKSSSKSFEIDGNFSCKLEQNTIYKAYKFLIEIKPEIEEFFKTHRVVVKKRIPEGSGLGGGSSNCATFLKLIRDEFNLEFEILRDIGSKIGADVSFFLYDYDVANVSGVGEIVEKVEEKLLDLEVITPNIHCNTRDVYVTFRDRFYKESKDFDLIDMNSMDILNNFGIKFLNDLLPPALYLYPELESYTKEKLFFSGSGSSFFRVKG